MTRGPSRRIFDKSQNRRSTPSQRGRGTRPFDTIKAPVKNFIAGIEQMASTRLNICHDCNYWDAQFRRCKACGCFTSAKARLPQAKCPKGYWGPATR